MQTTLTTELTGSVRAFPGTRMHFRLGSEQTNNSMAIIDIIIYPGAEPPRHVHQNEDECVILTEGQVTFYVGEDVIEAKAGDIIFLPRNIPHHFKINSLKAAWRLILTPGGFEKFFEAATLPYNGSMPPVIENKPSSEQIGRLVKISQDFGAYFVN